MRKERASNLELLRIILMCMVPLYHLMVYNGIVFIPYFEKTVLGLFLVSGSAITADYAFMALSSYFLIQSREKPVIVRFLTIGLQVLTIYLMKMITLRQVLGYHGDNPYIEDFLIHGAWWFAYGYLILLLVYPVLNRWIFSVQIHWLRVSCMIVGMVFLINGIYNMVHFGNDLIAFLFTYLFMGYLERQQYQRLFIIRNSKRNMLLVYFILFLGTFLAGCIVKYPGVMADDVIASEIVRRMVGKYSFIQFIMGIALFLFFRELSVKQSKMINRIARATFLVFLLHETIMGVWWYFGLADYHMRDYSMGQFLVWCILYVLSCYAVAFIVQVIYEHTIGRWGGKQIQRICETKLVLAIEHRYCEVQRWQE